MLETVRGAVHRHRLIRTGDRVLAAVSGGPDSVALLHLLLRLKEELSMDLHVFHLDHGLRAGSAEDAAFVRRLAKEWGVPAHIIRENVAEKRRRGESTQEAARRLRYAALRRTAAQIGATRVALGHHADDQAETVLMRLLRGAGAAGLGGMRRRRGMFIRPLLDVTRADVEAYCRMFRLPTRQDPTNLKTSYFRNKVRLQLLPLLETEYNPNVRLTLNRMATLLQDDDDLLEYWAHRAFRRLRVDVAAPLASSVARPAPSTGQPSRLVALAAAELARQPRALRRRVVRHAWRQVAGVSAEKERCDGATPAMLTFEHVEAVLGLLEEKPGAAVDLPRRVRVRREGGALVFQRAGDGRDGTDEAYTVPLTVPGATEIPGGRVIEAAFIERPQAAARPGRDAAWLDWEKLRPPLIARTWRPGDRMRPLGLGGTKKLQDLFVDDKIPAAERRRTPIVVDGLGIVWAAGLRVDERAAAGPDSKTILQLKIVPL